MGLLSTTNGLNIGFFIFSMNFSEVRLDIFKQWYIYTRTIERRSFRDVYINPKGTHQINIQKSQLNMPIT